MTCKVWVCVCVCMLVLNLDSVQFWLEIARSLIVLTEVSVPYYVWDIIGFLKLGKDFWLIESLLWFSLHSCRDNKNSVRREDS